MRSVSLVGAWNAMDVVSIRLQVSDVNLIQDSSRGGGLRPFCIQPDAACAAGCLSK